MPHVIPPGIENPGILISNYEAVLTLQRAIISTPRDIHILRATFLRVIEDDAWRLRLDPHRGQVFKHDDFRRFITAPLAEGGLETTEDTIRQFLGEGKERLAFEGVLRDNTRPEGGGNNNPWGCNGKPEDGITVDNINSDSTPSPRPTGTSIGAAVRRLARERPDLLERVEAGELSAHRAMIQAGFRKVPTPLEVAQKEARKLNASERQQLRQLLDELDRQSNGQEKSQKK